MAHLTRQAVISGVIAGSLPETAAGNRAYTGERRVLSPLRHPCTLFLMIGRTMTCDL